VNIMEDICGGNESQIRKQFKQDRDLFYYLAGPNSKQRSFKMANDEKTARFRHVLKDSFDLKLAICHLAGFLLRTQIWTEMSKNCSQGK
jgi:hypothetical protein